MNVPAVVSQVCCRRLEMTMVSACSPNPPEAPAVPGTSGEGAGVLADRDVGKGRVAAGAWSGRAHPPHGPSRVSDGCISSPGSILLISERGIQPEKDSGLMKVLLVPGTRPG